MAGISELILDAVRIGLSACVADRRRAHPDSSRQRKARAVAVSRREARRMKQRRSTYVQPVPYTSLGAYLALNQFSKFYPTVNSLYERLRDRRSA